MGRDQGADSPVTLVVHPEVAAELSSARDWYEQRAAGLGDDFLAELDQGIEVIMAMPRAWPPLRDDFRHYTLSRFPFSIVYQLVGTQVLVLAVMHHARQPGYWLKRL